MAPRSQLSVSLVGNDRTARDTQARPGRVSHPWVHPAEHTLALPSPALGFPGVFLTRQGCSFGPSRNHGQHQGASTRSEARPGSSSHRLVSIPQGRHAGRPQHASRAPRRSVKPGETREVSRSGGSSYPRSWAVSDFCSLKRCFTGAWVGLRMSVSSRLRPHWASVAVQRRDVCLRQVLVSGGTAVVLGHGGTNTSVWCQKALPHC